MGRIVWAVIRREYLQRVRSKWFVFGTVVAPLLMASFIMVPVYLSSRSQRAERQIAVVDATGVLYERLAPELESGGWAPEQVPWTEGVLDRLTARAEEGEIGGFVVLDEVTLTSGEATFYGVSEPSALRRLTLRSAVARAALEHGLEERGVDAEALLRGGELRVELVSGAGADSDEPEFGVAYVGAFILYMVILQYAVAVMRATLEEKTSRIVEIVISSMEPWHLMLGKIVGVGAVSLTQVAVWIASGVLLATLGLPMLLASRPDAPQLAQIAEVLPSAGLLALFVGFFVFGFLMYSGLYAAVGAMCNTDEEAQQTQLPLVLLIVPPILLVLPVIESPMTPMATVLSLFPLFTPILMWGRVAGRIYKTGILMTGKRPTLPELWRWVREA
jgi:ABC-2 type transport system permease protein